MSTSGSGAPLRPRAPNYVLWEPTAGGGTTYVQNQDTGAVSGYATELAALEYCRDNGPANETVAYIRGPFIANAQFVIDRSNFGLVTDWRAESNLTHGVWIRQIQVDSTSAAIRSLYLKGISTREFHVYANGNEITEILYDLPGVYPDSTNYHGLIFEGDGTTDGWMNDIKFRDLFMQCTQTGTTWGNVTFVACRFATEIYFVRPDFNCYGSTDRYLYLVKEDANINNVFVSEPRVYTEADNDLVILAIETRDAAYNTGINWFSWLGGRVEAHHDYTILQMAASAAEVYLGGEFANCRFQVDSGDTLTVFNVPNTFFPTTTASIDFHHNNFVGEGTARLAAATGTMLRSNRCDFIWKNNQGLFLGNEANPFEDGAVTRYIITKLGANASPTASRTYEIQGSDILITSTDSGDTNCSITIQDQNGNNYLAGLSTLGTATDPLFIPRGYTINWGAFTGAAPTVSVFFCD